MLTRHCTSHQLCPGVMITYARASNSAVPADRRSPADEHAIRARCGAPGITLEMLVA
jgi:hypothetical protein